MKKAIILVLAIVVLGGGVWWFMSQQQPASKVPAGDEPTATQSQDNTQSGEVTVTMKNTAFSPQSIKIKKGTKVTWVNQDSVQHNVVAADADVSGGLPTTNALLSKDGSYSFTFNQTGTFDYHCTPHPFMTGTVEVVE